MMIPTSGDYLLIWAVSALIAFLAAWGLIELIVWLFGPQCVG